MSKVEIKGISDFELFLKTLLKDRVADKELKKLCMRIFKMGIDYGSGHLFVDMEEER